MRKRLVTILAIVLAPWLFYVIVGNLLIATPILEKLINRKPERFLVTWGPSFTWFPGFVWVKDFRLSFQAPRVAFELTIDEATGRIVLPALLKKRFRATHIRSSGVSYKMYSKDDPAKPISVRLAAYPHIRGAAPLVLEPPGKPKTKAEIDKLWAVQLDDIQTSFREVWLFEYHWKGKGRAQGAFALQPMKNLWVGPCTISMEPGELTVGDELVSSDCASDLWVFVTPVEIDMKHKLMMLRGLQVDGTIEASLRSLELARLYGAEATGTGELFVDAHVKNGTLQPEMKADVKLADVHGRVKKNGGGFDGALSAKAWLDDGQPQLRVVAGGAVSVPLPGDEVVEAKVPRARASVVLTTNDMTQPWRLGWFDAEAPELEIENVKPLLEAFKNKLPAFVPALVGDKPLLAHSLEGRGTPTDMHLRIGEAKVRETQVNGEVDLKNNKPTGALLVKIATLPIGITLNGGKPGVQFFPKGDWLQAHLDALPRAQGRRKPGD